jgi:hypothetical protein
VRSTGRIDLHGESVFARNAQASVVAYFRDTRDGVESRSNRSNASTPLRSKVVQPESLSTGVSWTSSSVLQLIESRTFARGDRIIPRRLELMIDRTVVEQGVEVTIPAGRFPGCIRITGVSERTVRTDGGNSRAVVNVDITEWYASGVGLVKRNGAERSDSTFVSAGQQQWQLLDFGS